MSNCISCKQKIPYMAKICPACKAKQIMDNTCIYPNPDKDEFAFHTEFFGDDKTFDRKYSEYNGYIYENAGSGKIYRYQVAGPVEYLMLKDETKTGDKIVVNQHGLFLGSYTDNSAVEMYDFDGYKKGIWEPESDEYTYKVTYIYGTKMYYIKKRKEGNPVEKQDVTFNEYDFSSASTRCIFDLRNISEEIYELILEQTCAQAIDNDIDTYFVPESINDADVCEWYYSECSIEMGFVNNCRAILKIDFYMEDGGDLYGGIQDVIIEVDLDTLKYQALKRPGYRDLSPRNQMVYEIEKFDMLHNMMWVREKTDTLSDSYVLRNCSIKPLDEINPNTDFVDEWKKGDNDYLTGNTYFDGEYMYYGKSYCEFWSYKKTGEKSEWNQSGHGGADNFNILGDWMYVNIDRFYESYETHVTFMPKSHTLPGQGMFFTITNKDLEAASEVIRFTEAPAPAPAAPPTPASSPAQSDAMTIAFCPYCGTKVMVPGAKFCFACGKELPVL